MLKVQDRSGQIDASQWPLIDALLGGTPAMRKAGPHLLPMWPEESREHYAARLATATLFPAFDRTVGVMSDKPFAKKPTLTDVPDSVGVLLEDVDQRGHNLQAFAAPVLAEVLSYGFAGVLVDFPKSNARTQADQIKEGARPYWVWIHHDQILGWRHETVGGAQKLTLLRLAETAEAEDGDYGTKTVNRVRVFRPGAWELWEDQGDDNYVLIDEGTISINEIPYVAFTADGEDQMVSESPLRELAYLNAKHWQSQSDQDTILHVARVPILFGSGFGDDDTIVVGSSRAVKSPNADAKLAFVEHTGKSIGAGKESLEALEEQMEQTGAELLIKRVGNRTATEDQNDEEGNKSRLQRIVESFEDALDYCLYFTAKWLGQSDYGAVTLYKEFGTVFSDASADKILQAQQSGLIGKATAIAELQRRGILSPDIDSEAELAAIEEEGPPLGSV